ncbi:hypothetical protein RhiirA5_401372 [Rhizophagus irregularis]|uniref:RING-type domain-containing protein n=2 Tax=Rhizophagus irregularis TaxID=588596 RepID=A0A2N0PCN4_9GLOM|nr:hypothetical protein RhiirA5_401372 [Rhizophagus irregularis]
MSRKNINMENQESSANIGVESPNTPDDNNMEEHPEESDTEGPFDVENITADDIYKVQLRRNRSLKSLALSILKYLPKDILCEEPDFSSIKSNDFIQDYEECQECDKPILSEDPPKSLVLNVCGDMIHQTCAGNPDKRGVLLCPCGVSDDRDPSLLSEEEINVDGNEESARPEETNSTSNSGRKKRANEDTDSSASQKSKKHVQPEVSNILKKLIQELSSDTTRLSEIKEKRALYREAERSEKARNEVIFAYYYFGEELEKHLAHYRKTNEEHEAKKKLYDAVKDQLPKEVTKSAVRKKANRAGKVYDLFFRISDDKTQ